MPASQEDAGSFTDRAEPPAAGIRAITGPLVRLTAEAVRAVYGDGYAAGYAAALAAQACPLTLIPGGGTG
jgi:hypothetical protein